MQTTAPAAACAIERLPDELLVQVISRTAPRDACRAAAVSPAFRAAADSDAVWSCFVPRDLPPLADKELPPPASLPNKELFLRLCDSPVLLPDRLMRMWLDRETGAKCFTLSASTLQMSRFRYTRSRRLVNLGFNHSTRGQRFSQAVQFLWAVRHFEIRGRIHRNKLSPNSIYAAYMVFKLEAYTFHGLVMEFHQLEEATVSVVGGRESTRPVCLQGYAEDRDGTPQRHVLLQPVHETEPRAVTFAEDVLVARRRADGWMEVELGEFYNQEGGEDGEVCISLRNKSWGSLKRGFLVYSIEIRTKHESLASLVD